METKELSLEDKYKSYKEGKSDMPRLKAYTVINKNADLFEVVASKEIIDRDGEVVKLDGMQLPSNGIPFVDAHNAQGSAIYERLGTVKNVRVQGDEIRAEILFWEDTDHGKLAKKLAENPDHPMPVSMGFGVKEYDPSTKTILEWEWYELSAVNVPANISAGILKGYVASEELKNAKEDVEKKIKRFEQIQPAFKEFTKLFFSDVFTKRINLEKSENLVLDINKMYDILNDSLDKLEAPASNKTKKEAPKVFGKEEFKTYVSELLK